MKIQGKKLSKAKLKKIKGGGFQPAPTGPRPAPAPAPKPRTPSPTPYSGPRSGTSSGGSGGGSNRARSGKGRSIS